MSWQSQQTRYKEENEFDDLTPEEMEYLKEQQAYFNSLSLEQQQQFIRQHQQMHTEPWVRSSYQKSDLDAIEEEKYFETEERTHSWRVGGGKGQNF